jgi:hypothetical protein
VWTHPSAILTAGSMTRNSGLGTTPSTGYVVGDPISFKSMTRLGTFSQRAAIIVDAVDSGTITRWRFPLERRI